MKTSLDIKTVRRIKAHLWNGNRQDTIALHLGISQPTVSSIYRGASWPEVEWPDGSTGSMPELRRRFLYQQETKAKSRLAS